jgi:hypothetical protein
LNPCDEYVEDAHFGVFTRAHIEVREGGGDGSRRQDHGLNFGVVVQSYTYKCADIWPATRWALFQAVSA